MARPRETLHIRFWRTVQKTEGCWLWQGWTDRDGYGQISIGGKQGKRIRATAAAWLLSKGTLPTNNLLHTCDTPSCVRTDHLVDDTQAANMADMVSKGRSLKGEAHVQAVLTEALVLEIRASTRSNADWASELGLHMTTIWNARTRKSWKHI